MMINKAEARNKLNIAVKKGEVVRLCCQVCKKVNAEAHHTDYSKPFNVMWLCKKHHEEWHSKYGYPEGETGKLVTVTVLESDRKKLRKWSANRDMKIYEVVNLLINNK